MTTDQMLILGLLAVMMAAFLSGKLRHDVVALATLLAAVLAGLVPSELAFSGFGHPAVITVACVLILSRGLQVSGAVDWLAQKALPSGAGHLVSLAALMGLGAGLSAFMNNVGAMALLMPVAVTMAGRHGLAPGQVLMPLAFGTILGGMTTLIGTPPNLIVSGFRPAATSVGSPGFAMFDFAWVGVPVALTGIAFVTLLGWRLVPARKPQGDDGFQTAAYLTEVRVPAKSKARGKTLRQVESKLEEAGAQIVALIRDRTRINAPARGQRLRSDDILVIEAQVETLAEALSKADLKLEEDKKDDKKPDAKDEDKREAEPAASDPAPDSKAPSDRTEGRDSDSASEPGPAPVQARSKAARVDGSDPHVSQPPLDTGAALSDAESRQTDSAHDATKPDTDKSRTDKPDTDKPDDDKSDEDTRDGAEIVLREYVILPGAVIEGRSAMALQLRNRRGLNLLAVSRSGRRPQARLRTLSLRAGDVILLQGAPEAMSEFAAEYGCVPLASRALRLPDGRAALTAGTIMLGAVALATTGLVPSVVAFALGVLAVMVLKVVPLRDLYTAIDWPVIILLAALIPVAGVMETSGAARLIAEAMVTSVARGSPLIALAVVLVVTMFLSDVMNNAATAAVMCPVALGIAAALGVNSDPLLMGVAIGASCAFLTPIGHQNNTLILGPGGFGFGDYWKLGVPLEMVVVAVALPLLPMVFPF